MSRRSSSVPAWAPVAAIVLGLAVLLGVVGYGVNWWVQRDSISTSAAEANQRAFDRKLAIKAEAKAAAEEAATTLAVTRPAGRPMEVLFAGDSLTGGYYADAESDSYVALVEASLESGGPVRTVVGQQAGAGLATVSGLVDIPSDLDLAVIELGTNDVTLPTPLDQFGQDYAALLQKVRDANPDVPVLCLGVWQPYNTDERVPTYDDAIEQSCRAVGGMFKPLHELNEDPANHGPEGRPVFRGTSDVFHPNNAGHRAIADLVLGSLSVKP